MYVYQFINIYRRWSSWRLLTVMKVFSVMVPVVIVVVLVLVLVVQPVKPSPQLECPRNEKCTPHQDRTKVRPCDIRRVMALGDDLVAALAAKNHHLLQRDTDHHQAAVQEYKGASFATGHDPLALSLSTLLSSTSVAGSRGAHPVRLCLGGRLCRHHDAHSYTAPLQDRLNVALSGAMANSLPVQLQQLRRQYKRIVGAGSGWNLIIVHIGTVDLCTTACNPNTTTTTTSYMERLTSLLTSLNTHFPDSIVSLLALPDSSQSLMYMRRHKRRCDREARRIASLQCPCAMSDDARARHALSAHTAAFNRVIDLVAHKFNTEPGVRIGVHVSRVLQDTVYQRHVRPDYLSPLDCLHWTVRGHEVLAKSVWRSFFEPGLGHIVEDGEGVYCPGPDEYIQLHTGSDDAEDVDYEGEL
jgi:hypothetical protein